MEVEEAREAEENGNMEEKKTTVFNRNVRLKTNNSTRNAGN